MEKIALQNDWRGCAPTDLSSDVHSNEDRFDGKTVMVMTVLMISITTVDD
jgi:hypothetical protein